MNSLYIPIVTLPANEDAMPFVALSRALAGLWGVELIVAARVVVDSVIRAAEGIGWGSRFLILQQNPN